MDLLPHDVIDHMSYFLNMKDTIQLLQSSKKMTLSRYTLRKKRFEYCSKKFTPKRIKNGNCVNSLCPRRKLTCIIIEPLQSENLSNYCAPCFRKFRPNVNIHEFVVNR